MGCAGSKEETEDVCPVPDVNGGTCGPAKPKLQMPGKIMS